MKTAALSSFLFLAITTVCPQDRQREQSAGGVQPTGVTFQVVRSVSGSRGTQQGSQFVMDDPRTTFQRGKDAKIIVYFEWQGPVGQHRFEGLWKSPEGRVVMVSEFQYAATAKQFAGYWSMVLTEATPTGHWSLEARIDGESAGSHSFEITADSNAVIPPPAR